jgi:hypothetical protein
VVRGGRETFEFSAHGCVMGRMRIVAALFAVAFLLAGCSSTTSYRAPGKNLASYKKVWVEKNLSDDHNIHGMIAAELRALGYDVDSGFGTMMPRGIELVVTYNDQWSWDFRDYLIDIEVTAREPRSSSVVARGRYFRPGITEKAPSAMVRDVVNAVFKPSGKK